MSKVKSAELLPVSDCSPINIPFCVLHCSRNRLNTLYFRHLLFLSMGVLLIERKWAAGKVWWQQFRWLIVGFLDSLILHLKQTLTLENNWYSLCFNAWLNCVAYCGANIQMQMMVSFLGSTEGKLKRRRSCREERKLIKYFCWNGLWKIILWFSSQEKRENVRNSEEKRISSSAHLR